MKEYQKFPISNSRTGFNESLEPWLLPRDGYPYMKNAHLYRGVVEKIAGYDIYAKFSYSQIVALTGTINGINTVFTGTLSPVPSTNNFSAQAAINVGATLIERFSYSSDGTPPVVNLASNLGGTGTVNMTTGAVTLTFNTPPAIVPGGYNSVIFTYDYLSTASVNTTDIMGIKQYYAQNGSREIIVFNTRRAAKVVVITGLAAQTAGSAYGLTEIPHQVQVSNSATTPSFNPGPTSTFTGVLSAPVSPGSVKIVLYSAAPTFATISTITDNGFGLLTGVGTKTATGFINYATGAYTVTLSSAAATTDLLYTSSCVYGDTFIGDFTNFFSTCNYQWNMFITNNVDNIRYYDGMCILFLNTNLSVGNPYSTTYEITRCLHVAINRDRLLLLAPVVNGQQQLNTIYWSNAGFPLLFTEFGSLSAPTSESIRLYSFINSDMIVRFANSERVFTYTSDVFLPFRWDSTNVLWRCDTNYSDINYDSWFSSVGRPGIVGSDGVNVQRADDNIPDFTLNNRAQLEGPIISISQTSIGQCYGERFDDFKEGWLCFKASTPTDSQSTERSDSVLAFNYLDNTYAVYDFPLSCLGFGSISAVDTWGDNFDLWGSAAYTWSSANEQHDALVDLAGDRFGNVYDLGDSSTRVNELGQRVPIYFDLITKNFNPFVEEGQLCRFGYLDLFVSADTTTKVRVQLFVNDNLYVAGDGSIQGWYQETTLDFVTTDNMSSNPQAKVWKRIYSGAIGKEHTVRIYQNPEDFTEDTLDQPVRLHCMIMNLKPAGQLFN